MEGSFTSLENLLISGVKDVAPSIVCRIEHKGSLVYERAFGDCTTNSLFDLASLTKLWTTTAFLRLIDNKLVTIDQSVGEILPEFLSPKKIGDTEDPISKVAIPCTTPFKGQSIEVKDVTFRHLLSHSSGLPAWRSIYKECGEIPAPLCSKEQIADRQQKAFAAVTSYDFSNPVGTEYVYSDVGLILLGYAVARLTKKETIADAIKELVTDPLNMEACFLPLSKEHLHSRIVPTEACAWRNRRLLGEVHDENCAGMGGISGHAGMFGTAEDVCKLAREYMKTTGSILHSDTIKLSTTEHFRAKDGTRRGLGWMLKVAESKDDTKSVTSSCGNLFSSDSFGHTGYTGTSLWCDPQRDLVVCLLTNRVYNGRIPQPIQSLRVAVHDEIAKLFPLHNAS